MTIPNLRRVLFTFLATAAACSTQGEADPEQGAPAEEGPVALLSRSGYRVADLAAVGGGLHLLVEGTERGDPLGRTIHYLKHAQGRWWPPIPVFTSEGTSHGARLFVDPSGAVEVFWYEDLERRRPGTATHVLVRSLEQGAWTVPIALYEDRSGFTPQPMSVAAGHGGPLHLLHAAGDRGLRHAVRTDGRWWPMPYTDDGGYHPKLIRTAEDLAFAYIAAIASPGQSARSDVYVRRLTTLAMTDPVAVHRDPVEYAHHPQVLVDSRGVWHTVWLEGSAGDVPPARLLYASSEEGEGWTPATELVAADTMPREVFSPRLNLDARGRVHLTFTRARERMEDYRLHHAVLDRGSWSVPRPVSVPVEGAYVAPRVEAVIDREDVLHVVWIDAEGGVQHERIDASG